MNRSVYSLVLMDSVVEGIDREAYRLGTSRSNLINQVLAEYLSISTPEMRMKEIFQSMQQLVSGLDALQIQAPPSDAMLSLRSVLRVKYNPTARYSVELYRNAQPLLGMVKVSFRTQSRDLLDELGRFFAVWIKTEALYNPAAASRSRAEDGRFLHEFAAAGDARQAATRITQYINTFDTAMKNWFDGGSPETIAKIYLQGGLQA